MYLNQQKAIYVLRLVEEGYDHAKFSIRFRQILVDRGKLLVNFFGYKNS